MTASNRAGSTTAFYAVPGRATQPVQLGVQALLDGHPVIYRLARDLTPTAADLVEIAVTVYLVDQLVGRPAERTLSDGSTWARNLWLQIPVREPQLWDRHAGFLTQMLAWLTDDHWDLEFAQRASGTGPLDTRETFLFNTIPARAAPVLFSGGLDSAAGPGRIPDPAERCRGQHRYQPLDAACPAAGRAGAAHGIAAYVRAAALPRQHARAKASGRVIPAIPRTAVPGGRYRDCVDAAPGPAAGIRERNRRDQPAVPAFAIRFPSRPGQCTPRRCGWPRTWPPRSVADLSASTHLG